MLVVQLYVIFYFYFFQSGSFLFSAQTATGHVRRETREKKVGKKRESRVVVIDEEH
jgi:hypothetical protein